MSEDRGFSVGASTSKNCNKTNHTNTHTKSAAATAAKTWIHPDDKMQDGVIYSVKYVGRVGINESMKSLNFETRTQVARESIRRVAECAKLLIIPRRNRKTNEEQLNQILSNTCNVDYSGLNVSLQINVQYLKVTHTDSNEKFFQHTMQNISFACGGDTDIQDFVAYVAKDEEHGRACYVFECPGGLANSVITTIGQAFELRFKNFLNSNLSSNTSSNNNNNSNINRNANVLVSPAKSSNATNNNNNFKFKPEASAIESHHSNNSSSHFENNSTNTSSSLGSAASSAQLRATPLSSHSHNSKTTEIPPPAKNFNPKAEQLVLANNTNTSDKLHHHKAAAPTTNGTSAHSKIDDKLERMKWFHGLLTREMAERLLVKDGDYLVRETNKADRQYVLSGRYKGECRHIFLVDPSGVVRTKDKVFDNICHLIQYHQDNNIPIISKDNELLLEHPICKPV